VRVPREWDHDATTKLLWDGIFYSMVESDSVASSVSMSGLAHVNITLHHHGRVFRLVLEEIDPPEAERFVVGCNMPGCPPEVEPETFHTFEEAWNTFMDMIEGQRDSCETDAELDAWTVFYNDFAKSDGEPGRYAEIGPDKRIWWLAIKK
jgi:hypothetical protein